MGESIVAVLINLVLYYFSFLKISLKNPRDVVSALLIFAVMLKCSYSEGEKQWQRSPYAKNVRTFRRRLTKRGFRILLLSESAVCLFYRWFFCSF